MKRPQVRTDYDIPQMARYLNDYLLGASIEINKLIDSYRLSNYTATTNPTINDDLSIGYKEGSTWLNTSTNKWYFCNSAAVGAANWVVIN